MPKPVVMTVHGSPRNTITRQSRRDSVGQCAGKGWGVGERLAGSRAGDAVSKGSLTALPKVRPIYFLPADPLVDEVLIPGFRAASAVRCMAGFFSSDALGELAPGLAPFIAGTQDSFQLIISPFLRPADRAALEGDGDIDALAQAALAPLVVTADLLEQHTLKCLTYLLRTGRIEIKIALLADALFHPKVWLFVADDAVMAAHGSSNLTVAGVKRNFEQISVSRSWEDTTQRYITDKLQTQFSSLWQNNEPGCSVVPLPSAIREKLLLTYSSDRPPTEAEFRQLYERATAASAAAAIEIPKRVFRVPADLQYTEGPFAHQGAAVEAWCNAGYRGILEMATGSGKTITSMIAACRLAEEHSPLMIVIAAPYVPLIEQWCEEVEAFGLRALNLTTIGNASERAAALQRAHRRLRTGLSHAEAIVVSHDTLCTAEFVASLMRCECERMLIADEVHNLGRSSFVTDPPTVFEHRLGLSATPIRQYDPEGTDALFDFFGPVVYQFTLKEAIGKCLVEYDYFVHPVRLSDDEMDHWRELTAVIRQNAWRIEAGGSDDFMVKLLRDRRLLLETAAGKLSRLGELLDNHDLHRLKHTLIYASDKAPDQLLSANNMLRSRGVLFHQLTAEETADRVATHRIIKAFQDGSLQVLTAKRVLDEGVNIPQIQTAFVLASTTVERQWIQRRGRLLRTCAAIGKTHSVIHDFLVLPPDFGGQLDSDARSLLRSELKRIQEFASLARNAGRPDGPLHQIHDVVMAIMM